MTFQNIWLFFFAILIVLPNSYSLAQGETCANAVSVTSLPFDYSGTTCGSDADYTIASTEAENPNLCSYPDPPLPGQSTYIEGEDFVFEFTPTESSCYDFIFDSNGGSIHIFDTCPDDPLVNCLGYRRNNTGAPVTVNTNIESGNTVYIVISDRIGLCGDFDLMIEIPESMEENDFCYDAIELQTTGSNAGATDCGEPDDWAPENYPGVDCLGGSGGWSSNENGVWFSVTVDPSTPQPFSITITNVNCVGGGELLQMGLWEDIGDCSLSESTFVQCAIGIGTIELGPLNIPLGDYHLFVDGQNGSDCTWEFESELLCNDLSVSATPTDESCSGMMDGEITVVGSGGTPPLSYTIDGTPTSIPITGLSAGTYTIEVSDDEGCTDETIVTVGSGVSPIISATPIDESCSGTMDGEITVVGSGGTPPLSYTIDGTPTPIPITGLSAGTYTVSVSDANGCTVETIVTVGSGVNPTISTTPIDESCSGTMDGEITVVGSGGTPPLSYTIDGTPTPIPITGLSAGTYTVSVSDANGCTVETIVTVGSGVNPIISATPIDESCSGTMDGEITVVGNGGTPPLSYTIDGTPTPIPITGLSAGTYTVSVSDANGCTNETIVTVGSGVNPTISTTPIDESCSGTMDGEITVVGNGGTPPLSYTIDGTPTSIPITGLSAGTYTVSVSDANGCTDETIVTVGSGVSPTISTTPIDESCSGTMDGEITVVGTGGTPPLSYTIDGTPTSIPITGLSAGTYTVSVSDANGCTDETIVTVGSGVSPTISTTPIDESCSGTMDGEITVVGTGGTPPLSYTIDGTPTSIPITGLSGGTYTVSVSDANGCTDETIVTVGSGVSPTISTTPIDESCSGTMDGEITVVGSGGTPPLSYTIDGIPTSIPITGLSAGTYTIGVVDVNGCADEVIVTVSAGVSPIISATPIDESCSGTMDGEITVVGNGGTPPLSYTIDGTPTSIPITGLSAGTYTIGVVDVNGCADEVIVTVGAGVSPIISATPVDESCSGTMDGEITVVGSGGTPPLSYTIDGTPTSIPITGLSAGTYTIGVVDVNGCADEVIVTVSAGVSPIISATPIDESCSGTMDGEITVVGNGGTPPLFYTIDGTPTSIPITGLSAGTYTIGVVDVNGCADEVIVTVSAPSPIILFCSATGETAPNAEDGIGTIDISGGTPLYDISWTGPSSGTSTDEASGPFIINDLIPGTYSVTVSDANDCSSECTFIVQPENCNATASASLSNPISCFGDCTGGINVSIIDGATPYTFEWTGPTMIGDVQNPIGLCAGTYSVLITDNNGCEFTTSLIIDEPSELQISCSATGETAPNAGDGIGTIDISGGTPLYDISWTGPSSGTSTDEASGPFIINDLIPGTYSITVSDANDCSSECTFIVQPENCNATASASLSNPISCFGDCTGGINVSIIDGAAPYIFEWTGPTMIGDIQNPTGLCAGTYSVLITDNNGCEFTTSLIIDEPSELQISCSATGETAPNAGDGIGTIDISGGTPLYDISWTGPSSGTSTNEASGTFLINDLSPGTYSVTVTDANDCSSECTFIVQPENCNATASASLSNPISCFGDCTGGINVSIIDGAAPYIFEWTGPTMIGDIQNPTGLCAGTYSVLITDNNGCEFTTSLIIDEPSELQISCSATGETAPNAGDGIGTIDISGGTPLYDISWTGTSSGTSTNEASGTFLINDLSPGTYSVTVTDANDCSSECTFIVQPENCNATASASLSNPISCFGDCTGGINVSIIDGAAPYTFEWTGPTMIGDIQNPTGLCAGTYSVLITDNNGCEFTTSLNIEEGDEFPIANIEIDGNINCANSMVTLDGTSSIGVISDFEWSFNNATISIDPTVVVSQGGTYMLTVTTANGCSNTYEAVVNVDSSVPIANGGLDQSITCDQDSVLLDGSNSFGGNLLWNGPGITVTNETDINPIVDQVGTYTLTVTNTLGCTAVDTVEIFDGTVVVDVIIQSTENVIDCEVVSILLDGTSSEPSDGIIYTWSDLEGEIPLSNEGTLLVTQSGTYILTILDIASGCSGSEEINIISNTDFPAIAINTPELITCDNPFSLLDGTGSTEGPNIVYQWLDEFGNPIMGANDISYSTNVPGSYSLLVRDSSNECTNIIETLVLSDLTPPIADAGDASSLDCATFEIELDGSNSSAGANITYEWFTTNGNLISGLSSTNPIVDAAGEYIIEVTNEDNGCVSEDTVLVDNLDNAPQEILLSINDPTCFGDDDGSILIDSIVGGTSPYMYSFDNENFSSINQFSNLIASSYTIFVQDAQDCEVEVTVTISEPNPLSIDVGEDENIQLGESVNLNAIFNIPFNQIDSFSWLNPATLDCENCFDPVAQPTETTLYEAIVYDLNGCFAVDEVTIFVKKDRLVYIPNAFSPNGDGANDLFTIYSGAGVKRINELRIYDRWGENVFFESDFEPNDLTLGWDGTFKGQIMNPGVFVYWTEIEFEDGAIKFYKGDVSLLK